MEQSHNRIERYQSEAALNVEITPVEERTEPKSRNRKSSRQRGDEALTFIISAFYAKFLVILGIALPITDAIATSNYKTHDAFLMYYIYLYLGSIVFLLYMYLIHVRQKTARDVWRRSAKPCEEFSSEKNRYVRYGSFYFRMGVIGFGIGSVIYSSLQFGQYFEMTAQNGCDNALKAVKPLLRIIFVLMQMLFIFSHSNFLDVQRSRIIARFGLMHMIATNLCDWLFVLVEETFRDIYKSAKEREREIYENNNATEFEVDFQFLNSTTFKITKQLYEHKINCLQSNIIEPILNRTEFFLGPCTVEYGLLCAVILVLMWKDDRTEGLSNDCSLEDEAKQSSFNIVHRKRQSQFSVDCAQSHKGLFSGLLTLAITIISLLMFFELVQRDETEGVAILEINIWETILFAIGTMTTVFCLTALRNVKFVKIKKDLELEHLLLLVTQWGVYLYSLFQIIGVILMGVNKGTGGIMRIISPFSAVLESSCQTVLILDAWRRRCNTPLQMRLKPGRQHITFLLVENVALWIVNRLKNNSAMLHPNQMEFYGVLAWNVITHVSMPLVISYRFMSSVCFYEIWKRVYKMTTGNDDKDPTL